MQYLYNSSDKFSLIQAMRILYLHKGVNAGTTLLDYTKIRANLELIPPHAEIHFIENGTDENEVDRLLLTVTLFQLYGAGSPLPLFYTQELIHEQNQGNSVSRDFLDLINSPVYESYFKLWQKCSLLHSLYESSDNNLWERLFCLTGLRIESLKKHFSNPAQYIAFSGLTSRMIKTAEGLRHILSELKPDVNIKVEQCVTRKAPIPEEQRCLVGIHGNALGESVYLGKYLHDRMNKFRIHIGPLDVDAFNEFLPDGPLMRLFSDVIRLYIDRLFIWDCQIGVQSQTMETTQPGNKNSAKLGWNTWLFSGKMKGTVVYSTIKPKPV